MSPTVQTEWNYRPVDTSYGESAEVKLSTHLSFVNDAYFKVLQGL